MRVDILAPGQWRNLLSAAGPADSRRLTALLTATHGQHAGLPVALARAWLGDPKGDLQGRLRARLNDALMRLPRDDRERRDGRADMPDLRATFLDVLPPSLLVQQALVPLAREVCATMGRTILFGETASDGALGAMLHYDDYTAEFTTTFARNLELRGEPGRGDPMGSRRIFWDRLAFLLLTAAETAAEASAGALDAAAAPPAVDGGLLHFIKTLEPRFPRRRRTAEPVLRNTQTSLRKVPLKQGGVRGIRQTRSLQDLSDRLVSELMQPPFLQLERLLNSGFLVHHRPPPLDNRRNLLLVGLVYRRSDSSGPAFAKALWLDAAERLAILLVRAGLDKTDLVHVTRFDDHAATRVAVAVETHREQRRDLDAFAIGARERLAMLRTHGWLPGFVDTLPSFLPPMIARPAEPDPETDPAFMLELERTMLAAFRGFPKSAETSGGREQVFAAYAKVHVQIFLPGDLGPMLERDGLRFERLARRLGLPGGSRHNIVAITVPDTATGDFRILQAHRGASTIRGTKEAVGRDLDAVAADLSGALLAAALETVDG